MHTLIFCIAAFVLASSSISCFAQTEYDKFERDAGSTEANRRKALEARYQIEVEGPYKKISKLIEGERRISTLKALASDLREVRAAATKIGAESAAIGAASLNHSATRSVERIDAILQVVQNADASAGTSSKRAIIQYRSEDGKVSGNCGDGSSFSASFDGVYRTMPYGACAHRKGCESGATIEDAIRRACRE